MSLRLDYIASKDDVVPHLPKPYNLKLPFEPGWRKAKGKRALIIIEHISRGDLKCGALLGDTLSRETYSNLLSYSKKIAASYGVRSEYKFSFFNFNYMKTYHLDSDLEKTARKKATKRCQKYIDRVKPDLIIVIGDVAAECITGNQNISKYRGWIHDYKGMALVNTVDIDRSFNPSNPDSDDLDDDAVNHANILGYAARVIAYGLMGYHPHSVADVKINPRVIRTVQQFDKLMDRLNKSRIISVDTEGTALQTLENKLLTIQFAVNRRKAYILPVLHKDATWSSDELQYINSRLFEFFSQPHDWFAGSKTRYLIGQNFGYDMRMIMHYLNIRYWYWPTWDLQAGEYALDENIKVLEKYGTAQYGLAQIATNYHNDFYLKAEFSKNDRMFIEHQSLKRSVTNYMAADVQLPFAIHSEQIKRSRHMDHYGEDYERTYKRLVLVQISSMIRMMSAMKYRGTKVDTKYLINLLKPDSPVVGHIEKLKDEFYSLPEVIKADSKVRANKNIPTKSLFGGKASRVFDLSKREHLETLYIEVMKLEPLKVGKSGDPSFDKFFLKAYVEHKPCEIHHRLNVLGKIKSSYVDAFWQHIENSFDSRTDGRLRPDFGYVGVVTGRSNSSKPSLQQIPEHSEDAKLVKRMFVSEPLQLAFEADYSAHEVRCWGIISYDGVLGKTFITIHNMIVKYRKKPTEKNKKKLELEGDPHKVNYSFFTGTPIAKIDKDMRQQSKGITFGSMYGMGLPALAASIKKTIDEARSISNKFFAKFSKAGKWLTEVVNFSSRHYYVASPLGRRRHLFGFLSAHGAVIAAMGRRAQNSPIQGMASDICFIAADLFARALHECYTKLEIPHDNEAIANTKALITRLPTGPNAMVHDSIKGESKLDVYLLNLHLLEWAMTNGARQFLKKQYKLETNAPFDIDIEIGTGWSLKTKWDWSEEGLKTCITNAIEQHKSIYPDDLEVRKMNPKIEIKRMFSTYEEQKSLLKLDKLYPLNTGS